MNNLDRVNNLNRVDIFARVDIPARVDILARLDAVRALLDGLALRTAPAGCGDPVRWRLVEASAGPGRGWPHRVLAATTAPDRPSPTATADLVQPATVDSSVVSIVARAQSGDPEAFGELYDRYVDMIYRYTYFRVSDRPLAEDLTSETFVRALRRITTFSWQGRDFGAWLITIARNLVADHYKSARYRLELPAADLIDIGGDRAAAGPEGQVLDSLDSAALLDAVRQLRGDQQEVIALRFLQGLSVAETALAMGKQPGAVKALQYRAVRSLAKLLPSPAEQ